MTDLTNSLPALTDEEKAEINRQHERYTRLQCLDNAVKLHGGSYDSAAALKTAIAFFAFVNGDTESTDA